MGLDVYLKIDGHQEKPTGSGIFVRENGQTMEISREEWDKRHPGREPAMVIDREENNGVYHANITHNLNKMADVAGIYKALWRPDEIGIEKAAQLIEPLQKGLAALEADPLKFQAFNPPNGWGDYEALVRFVRLYLRACEAYPTADVSVWR